MSSSFWRSAVLVVSILGGVAIAGNWCPFFSSQSQVGSPAGLPEYSTPQPPPRGAGRGPTDAPCPEMVALDGWPHGTVPFAMSDARVMSIYLGSDFACDGGTIVGLRLYATGSGTASLSNFTIRLQQTSQTALTSNTFINTGWTVCWHNNTTIQPGWNTLIFPTPFIYTTLGSTPNLLVDYSYSSTAPPSTEVDVETYTTGALRTLAFACNNCGCPGTDPLNWTTCTGCARSTAVPSVQFQFQPCTPTPPLVSVTGPPAFSCSCDTVTVTGSVSDPNGTYLDDVLEYRGISAPAWSVAAHGSGARTGTLYTWNTGSLAEGYYYLRVTGRNACNLTNSDQTLIYVSRAFDTVDLRSPADGAVRAGTVCFDGTAWDNNCFANYSVMYKPVSGGTYAPVDPNHPTYTAAVLYDPLAYWNTTSGSVPDGSYLVRLRGTDTCSNFKDVVHTVVVDNTPPVAVLSSALNCGTPTGTVAIVGTATDAHLSGWVLEYAGGDAHNWVTIASGTAPVNNATLGHWNTTGLRPCGYILRLRVGDQAFINCSDDTHVTEYYAGVQIGLARPGDVNCDGVVDFNDINPFVACLSGGPCQCP